MIKDLLVVYPSPNGDVLVQSYLINHWNVRETYKEAKLYLRETGRGEKKPQGETRQNIKHAKHNENGTTRD